MIYFLLSAVGGLVQEHFIGWSVCFFLSRNLSFPLFVISILSLCGRSVLIHTLTDAPESRHMSSTCCASKIILLCFKKSHQFIQKSADQIRRVYMCKTDINWSEDCMRFSDFTAFMGFKYTTLPVCPSQPFTCVKITVIHVVLVLYSVSLLWHPERLVPV